MAKCRFKKWLYGPKNKWLEEPSKAKQKKKERLIYKAPPVKCECSVKSNIQLHSSPFRAWNRPLLRPYG